MPEFSERSKKILKTCHLDLQVLFNYIIEHFDCSIIDGHRGRAIQELYYAQGKTKLRWPQSKHNSKPSEAVDAIPYPIRWQDRDRFYYFAGYVMGVAQKMGIKLRWGGDWNRDFQLSDNIFDDLIHFELMEG